MVPVHYSVDTCGLAAPIKAVKCVVKHDFSCQNRSPWCDGGSEMQSYHVIILFIKLLCVYLQCVQKVCRTLDFFHILLHYSFNNEQKLKTLQPYIVFSPHQSTHNTL